MTNNDNPTNEPTPDVQNSADAPIAPEPGTPATNETPQAASANTDQKIDDMVQAARQHADTATEAETDASPAPDVITIPRTMFNYIVVAVVFFVVGALMGSFVFPSGGGSSAETAALPDDFDARVRSVVVGVMEEAGFNVGGVQDGGTYEIAFDEDDPYMGNPDGPITIVEFSDFLCGFCGRFAQETLPVLMEEYGDQVRFVYRDFPIISQQASAAVALAAECAHDQDKFWEYHDVLFENSGNISSTDTLYGFAADLGMDVDQFQQCFENGDHLQEISEDAAYARELGLRGTPGFFINGRFVNGAVPIDTFRQIIDEELAELG